MKNLIILIFFTLISISNSTNLTSTPEILSEEPSKDCPVNCNNHRAGLPRRPVCGSDGKTYGSACHLRRAQCQQSSLSLKHRGKCKGIDERPCWTDRKFHLSKRPAPPVSMFTPACRTDGRYSPIQCFEVYCWCVDPRSGKPIPNTSVENAKPNCNRANRRRNGSGGGGRRQRPMGIGNSKEGKGGRNNNKNKRPCGRLDRTLFNKNMLDTFKMEYRRIPLNERTEDVTDILEETGDAELQRKVLEWKFASLDTNGDLQLEKQEYRGLRRLVRKVVPPRRCARTFTRTCDLNNDEKLSREEWTACLVVDFNMLQETDRLPGGTIASYEDDTSASVFNRGPATGEEETTEEHGCLVDRKTVLEEQNSNLNLYIPECTTDGRYKKTQCYTSTGYCFCVDEDTGKAVPGTSVKNDDPKCDSIVPPVRPMKGCPEPKKRAFLKDLMEFLSKKMPVTILSTNSSESFKDDDEIRMPTISASSVANWHFRSFDKNKDRALVRTEWKAFRTLVESQQSLRYCGKKLPRYCDINRDRKISLTEWLHCLGVSGPDSTTLNKAPITTTLNPGRQGTNPLEIFLKPED